MIIQLFKSIPGILLFAVFAIMLIHLPLTAQGAEFEKEYDTALSAFNGGQYDKAIALFQGILSRSRSHSLADNCQYWLGECFYAKSSYHKAIVEFEKVFTYSTSNKKDDAQLKLGLCYMRLKDNEGARREFTRLMSKYPDSEFVDLARKILKDL